MSGCLSRDQIAQCYLGTLPDETFEEAARHLEECPICQATAETVEEVSDNLIVELQAPVADDPFELEPELERALSGIKALGSTRGKDLEVTRAEGAHEIGSPASGAKAIRDYELLEPIGHGGMGTVWKAVHWRLKRPVALKLLPEKRTGKQQAVARFLREMEAVGRLQHSHLVSAYDAGEVEGRYFLAMEYLEGIDLAKLLRARGRFAVSDACELIRQAALGLQHAHEHGLVHRDVKPSNLMLTKDGVVKVLDLGLARLGPNELQADEVTGSDEIMGTGDYLAPEQALHPHEVDIRADIYGLGCTLYKFLAGHAPFETEQWRTAAGKILAHAGVRAPSLREIRPDIPERLAAIVERMLAKAPSDRFSTPAEVAEALACLVAGNDLGGLLREETVRADAEAEVQPAGGVSPPRRRSWGMVAAAAGAAAICLGILLLVSTSKGTVQIEFADAGAAQRCKVSIDGEEVRIENLGEPIRLRAGRHELRVMHGDLELESREFTVRGGGNELLHVAVPAAIAGTRVPPLPRPRVGQPGDPPLAVVPFDAKQARKHQEDWARHLGTPIEMTNSLGMRFVLVPPGEFWMGIPSEKIVREIQMAGQRHDTGTMASLSIAVTRRRSRVDSAVYLGRYEVTQGEYERVMGHNPSQFLANANEPGKDNSRHPVESVSWDDAVRFSQKLTATPGEIAAKRRYRLPTEAEWEHACRGGSTTRWWFGDEESLLGVHAWFRDSAGGTTHAVGQKPANAWGLHDMHGNVWEWCLDWDGPVVPGQPSPADPGRLEGYLHRVFRGGCWQNPSGQCRSANRGYTAHQTAMPFVGFRVACEVR